MNSSSSSELENDVFLPATIKPKLFSSGIGLFKRKRKSKNINDSKNMKDLLTNFPKQEPSLYSEVVKNKEELKFVIEGPIIAPKLKKKTQPSSENNYESSIDSLKSKSYPEESKKIISGVYKNNSLSKLDKNNEEIFKIDSLSPIVSPNLESINKLKEFYNLKYFTKYIAKDNYITRDLKEFEVGELHEFIDNTQLFFDKIYYLAPSVNYNFLSGISDKAGHYISNTHDHILYRYKITEVLGKGSYGTVIKCFDYKYNMNCALKIVKSTKQYTNCMRKEMRILQKLTDEYTKYREKGIVTNFFTQYLKSFVWRGHGIIVFKLYNKDLYHAKLGKVNPDGLKIIMKDLFGALIFMKKAHVIHCDLKPENIMMVDNKSYNVVIGDFGLSKINTHDKPLTDFNVQTCWYRSPEVAMHIPYSYESDLWSIGVILMELIIDYPIFRARTDIELFYLFIKLMGDNPNSMIQINPELRNFMVTGENKIKLDKHLDKIIVELKKIENPAIEELINGIIVWEPYKRLTLRECFDLANEIHE